jgi:hypothetical protein
MVSRRGLLRVRGGHEILDAEGEGRCGSGRHQREGDEGGDDLGHDESPWGWVGKACVAEIGEVTKPAAILLSLIDRR